MFFPGLSKVVSDILCITGVLGPRPYEFSVNAWTSCVPLHFVLHLGGTYSPRCEPQFLHRYSRRQNSSHDPVLLPIIGCHYPVPYGNDGRGTDLMPVFVFCHLAWTIINGFCFVIPSLFVKWERNKMKRIDSWDSYDHWQQYNKHECSKTGLVEQNALGGV